MEKEARRDRMKLSDRSGEVVALVIIGLVALFFRAHETQATGFFTPSFGPVEAIALYGSILVGAVGPLARMASGSRNAARPAEMLASLLWVASSAWLLAVFPFNFAHLGDVLPPVDWLHFLASLITNDIARLLLAIGVVGGMISIAINAILYIRVGALLRSGDQLH
jgi:hypothetical protein